MLWTYFFDSSQFKLNFPQRERRPPGMLFRFTSHHSWSSLFSVSVIIVMVIIIIIFLMNQRWDRLLRVNKNI